MTLRGLAYLTFTDTAYLLRGTVADDSGGGGTTVWGTVGTADCRIDPMVRGGNEAVVANRLDDRSTHVVTCPPGTPVPIDGRVEVSGRGVYEVTAVRDRTGELTRVFEAAQVS